MMAQCCPQSVCCPCCCVSNLLLFLWTQQGSSTSPDLLSITRPQQLQANLTPDYSSSLHSAIQSFTDILHTCLASQAHCLETSLRHFQSILSGSWSASSLLSTGLLYGADKQGISPAKIGAHTYLDFLPFLVPLPSSPGEGCLYPHTQSLAFLLLPFFCLLLPERWERLSS